MTPQTSITSGNAYFIKLGQNGKWEKDCIENAQTLRLSYDEVPHELCIEKRWDEVQKLLETIGNDVGAATRHKNQIKLFYEADENSLWITFFGDRLYWCFSEPVIKKLPDDSKTRPATGGWQSADINDKPLQKAQLSGALLRVQGFRGTICRIKEQSYLIRKINGIVQPEVEAALKAQTEYENRIEALIRKLNWKDFELLIDLIFRQAGWQRLSVLGKAEKTIDLDLLYPITNERFLVQIKSSAGQLELQDFCTRMSEYQDFTRAYFIVHSPSTKLDVSQFENVEVWFLKEVAHRVVLYGLADWVITKVD